MSGGCVFVIFTSRGRRRGRGGPRRMCQLSRDCATSGMGSKHGLQLYHEYWRSMRELHGQPPARDESRSHEAQAMLTELIAPASVLEADSSQEGEIRTFPQMLSSVTMRGANPVVVWEPRKPCISSCRYPVHKMTLGLRRRAPGENTWR